MVREEVVIFFNYHFYVLSIKAMDSTSQMPFFTLMMACDKERPVINQTETKDGSQDMRNID
jgi:hypothetical protein